MRRIMIGTPMYGGQCTAHYTFSNINLCRYAAEYGLDLNYQFTTSESLVTRARNSIVASFLKSDCSHLLFIDADIGFDPHDVMKLLNHDLDVVCAGYPAKFLDWNSISAASKSGIGPSDLFRYASPSIYNKIGVCNNFSDLIEVRESGTGFMMIARGVFDKLSNTIPSYVTNQFGNAGEIHKEFFSTMIDDGMLISEDYYFCRKWRSVGGKVYVDKSVKLRHVGAYVYESSPNHWVS